MQCTTLHPHQHHHHLQKQPHHTSGLHIWVVPWCSSNFNLATPQHQFTSILMLSCSTAGKVFPSNAAMIPSCTIEHLVLVKVPQHCCPSCPDCQGSSWLNISEMFESASHLVAQTVHGTVHLSSLHCSMGACDQALDLLLVSPPPVCLGHHHAGAQAPHPSVLPVSQPGHGLAWPQPPGPGCVCLWHCARLQRNGSKLSCCTCKFSGQKRVFARLR